MFQQGVAYDGMITFAPISRTANASLKIVFYKGRCVAYNKMLVGNAGIQLDMLISAKSYSFNDIEHTNNPKF